MHRGAGCIPLDKGHGLAGRRGAQHMETPLHAAVLWKQLRALLADALEGPQAPFNVPQRHGDNATAPPAETDVFRLRLWSLQVSM